MRKSVFLVIVAGALLSGCAVGQSINYGGVTPSSYLRGSGPLVVAVHDRRPEVVAGNKDAAYCGVLRGGFGNPFDLETAGRIALADEFNGAIVRGVSRAGFTVASIRTTPQQSDQQVAAAIAGKRALLIQIATWRSDTYNNTALVYDVAARVIDSDGRVLGQAVINGRDNLGGSFFNPPSHAKTAVPAAYRVQLERLLNHPSILQALQPPAPAPVAAPSS